MQTLDLIVSIVSKTNSSKLRYLGPEMVADLFCSLQHFVDCEKIPENKSKWSRLLRKLLLGIDRGVLGQWISSVALDKELYGSKRIRRFYYKPFESPGDDPATTNSSVLLQAHLNYLNYFRTLDPESSLVEIQAVQHFILSITEDTRRPHEKEYLGAFMEILINFILNEKDPALIKRLKLLIKDIGKRFRWSIEDQLKDSEQNAKIRRLELLKEIWAQMAL